jgi:hypothetical protein
MSFFMYINALERCIQYTGIHRKYKLLQFIVINQQYKTVYIFHGFTQVLSDLIERCTNLMKFDEI